MILLIIPLVILSVGSSLVYKLNKQSSLVTVFGSVFFSTIITAVAFAISFTFSHGQFDNFTPIIGVLFFAKAICWLFQVWIWVKAIKHVPVSIADPFTLIKMLLLAGASWLVFADIISVWEITLVLCVFGAAFAMGILQHRQEAQSGNRKYKLGLFLIAIWVTSAVLNTIATRYMADAGVNIFTYAFLLSMLSLALAIVWLVARRQSIIATFKTVVRDKIQYGIAITDIVPTYFYIPLALVMNLGVLDAILNMSTAIVILCGVVFLHERIRWYIYPFMIISITGSILLALISGHVI